MKLMKSTVKRTDEEDLFKILGDEAPVGICIMQDGKFCCFNSNFPAATGYTTDELVGKDALEIVVPEDREMVRENTIKMLKGKFTSPYQFRVIHKDGSIVWIMAAVKSIKYQGRWATLGSYMEVTERKQMEETLKESEENYRELADSITDIFFAMDEHLRYTYWNNASEILTGIRAEDAIGKSFREIFPNTPGTRDAEKVYRNVLKTRQPQTFVNDFDINGKHYIFEISAYPSRGGISVFVRNITERKQAEEALRRSEERYRTILEEIGDGYVETDLAGNLTFVNDAMIRILGYSREELIGMNFRALRSKEDVEAVFKAYNRVYKTGEPLRNFFTELICKDGRHVFGETSAFPIRNNEGKIIGFRGIRREITERKQAEEKLKESEQKYRLLFETSPDCIAQINREGKVLAANPAAARSLGVPLEELIGKTFFEVMPQEVAQHRLEDVRKVLDEWQPQIFEDEREGRYFHHIDIPTKTSDQKEAVQVITRDITESRKMEEALRQSEEKYRTLFDSSVTGAFVIDAETMKVVIGNQAASKVFGFGSVEEAIGVDPLDFIPPDDREGVLKLIMEEMFEQDSRRAFDVRAITKDGREIWISATGARTMHEGRLAGLISFTDITERKQAEEALRQSEERYRTILEEMEDGYFEVDLAGNLTYANNSVCRDLGYSMEELIGRRINYKDYTAKEDTESVFRVFNKVYRTGVPNKGFPWRTTRKDGSHGFAETSVSPLRNGKGEIIGFRGVGRDITERKQGEEALRQLEEKYRTIREEMGDGYFETDLAGNITFVNDAMIRRLGYSKEELIGMNYRALRPKEEAKAVFEAYNRMYKTGEPLRDFLTEIICKDGGHIFAETSAFPIKNDEGEIIGFRGIRRDITERKQAEEALRQSEEKYRTILERMEDAYFEVDLGGHFTFVNNSVCRDLGYSREELIGMSYKDFTIEDDIESVFRVFNEVYRTGVPDKGFPWRTTLKDGSHGFAETSVSLLRNSKGEIIGFRGVGRDVTERKQAEEKLRQSEENYKTLFNSSVVGMYVLDIETFKVVMGNRAAAEMAGFSSVGQGIGINPLDFVIPEDRAQVLEMATKEFEQDLRRTHEVRVITKDGRIGWISISSAKIMHEGKLAALVSISNITERKRMEEALRQNEENYRALFDSQVIGTFVLDAEFMKVVIGNQAGARMFGFGSAEETIGINPFDFVSPEDRERVFELAAKELFEQDLRRTHELRAITKDGREIWVSVTAARIMHGGRLAGLISFTDITERKRMEEALRQSKENYRALFDSAVIGALVVDAETMKVVMANEATLKMFGFSSPEDGVNAFDFIPPEDRQQNLERVVVEVFGKDSRKSIDLPVVTKDGKKIWVSVTGARIMHKGKLAGLFSFTDITERKQAEEALRQSEENYRALFDSSVIGTVLLDTETMKVVMVNQAALKMFGFNSVEEALELDPFGFILPEDREKYLEITQKAVFEQNSHQTYEIQAVTKNGREIWINTTAAMIKHKGKLAALISFADITEQKKQRELLTMTDRLASLGELASGTAHELNNPLTSIIGFSQLLMEREVPDDIREDLKLINNEAQRAASVTRNLLTFARKHGPVKQRNQINSILEDVLELRAYEHKANSIDVERQLDPDLPEIMVDYFQMQQVFMNIIINAEYFMIKAHNKGTLTIATKKQNDTVVISIADDGPGIPPENLKKIFDPFFTTKEVGKGTGLGLSICHGIVNEHGGQIYAKSQLGKGATFFVGLPISGS